MKKEPSYEQWQEAAGLLASWIAGLSKNYSDAMGISRDEILESVSKNLYPTAPKLTVVK